MSIAISLCDLTGNMVRPWVEAGFDAILVDPQHGKTRWEGAHRQVLKFAGTVEDWISQDWLNQRPDDVAAVFGFPPCTDMAVSGARWFESKRQADPCSRPRLSRSPSSAAPSGGCPVPRGSSRTP